MRCVSDIDFSETPSGFRLTLSPGSGPPQAPPPQALAPQAVAPQAGVPRLVEEVSLGWGKTEDELWVKHWGVYLAAYFGHVLKDYRHKMDPNVVALMDAGLAMNAVDFKRIEIARTRMWRQLQALLAKHDAIVTGTMCQPAAQIGRADHDYWKIGADGRYSSLDFTSVWNFVSPCPALSVPAGFTADGLPIGLQIIGRRLDDRGTLGLGAAIERLQPWAAARPSI